MQKFHELRSLTACQRGGSVSVVHGREAFGGALMFSQLMSSLPVIFLIRGPLAASATACLCKSDGLGLPSRPPPPLRFCKPLPANNGAGGSGLVGGGDGPAPPPLFVGEKPPPPMPSLFRRCWSCDWLYGCADGMGGNGFVKGLPGTEKALPIMPPGG